MLSMEEYAQMCIEDEKNRQANPVCVNCIYHYTEYGYGLCKLHEQPPEELDELNDKCPDWK